MRYFSSKVKKWRILCGMLSSTVDYRAAVMILFEIQKKGIYLAYGIVVGFM